MSTIDYRYPRNGKQGSFFKFNVVPDRFLFPFSLFYAHILKNGSQHVKRLTGMIYSELDPGTEVTYPPLEASDSKLRSPFQSQVP